MVGDGFHLLSRVDIVHREFAELYIIYCIALLVGGVILDRLGGIGKGISLDSFSYRILALIPK